MRRHMGDNRVAISFPAMNVSGHSLILPVETADGASYDLRYRYEKRGHVWYAILSIVTEVMPPLTPQASSLLNESTRLRMPTFAEEVEQRRREWAEVNGK